MTYRLRQERNVFMVFVFLAFAVLLAPLPRLAAVTFAVQQPSYTTFETIDRNGDGFVDRSEAAAVPGLSAGFARLDTNRDGRLDRVELAKR